MSGYRNMLAKAGIALVTAGAFGLAWVGQAAALPTPISSSISLQADADAGSGTVTDSDTDAQGATLNPLAAAASAMAVSGSASVTAHATGAATWVSAAQGQVLLSDIGWETVNVSSGSATLTGGTDWTYSFVADTTGTFTLKWGISGSGTPDTFGLNGFLFHFSGSPNQTLDVTTAGSLTRSIISGNTYTAQIENEANIAGGLGTRIADLTGTFAFNITTVAAVPQPAALVLLSVGVLWIALVRRVV